MLSNIALLILAMLYVHQVVGMNKFSDYLRPDGLLHMKIEKFSEFLKEPSILHSEPVFIRGLPWKLVVIRQLNTDHLNCYVKCNEEDTDNKWSCAAEGTLRLLGSNNEKKERTWKHTFSAKQNETSFKITKIEDLLNHANWLYDKEKDIFIIEAEIHAELPEGIKHTPPVRERDNSLANRMRSLWQNSEDANVQFLVGTSEDNQELFTAHKTILSSSSDVFRTMFRFDKEQKKALKASGGKDVDATRKRQPIIVDDVEAEAFRVMLNYIYTDDLSGLNVDNLFDVMQAADKYNISGLLQASADYQVSDTNSALGLLNNAQHLAVTADIFKSAKCLIDRCWEFVDQNIYSVMQSDQFLQIDRDLLAELLGRNELKMSHKRGYSDRGELSLWRAVLRWADVHSGLSECSGQDRRKVLGPALYKIRFTLIDEIAFAREIVPTGVLTIEEMFSVFLYYTPPAEPSVPEQYPPKFCNDSRA